MNRLAVAQSIYDNQLPPEPVELSRAQEDIIKKTLDWASIPDWVDEINGGLSQYSKKVMSKEQMKDLADSINDLVATKLGEAV